MHLRHAWASGEVIVVDAEGDPWEEVAQQDAREAGANSDAHAALDTAAQLIEVRDGGRFDLGVVREKVKARQHGYRRQDEHRRYLGPLADAQVGKARGAPEL